LDTLYSFSKMDIVLSSIATDSMHFIHNALSKSLEFNKMQIDLDIALIVLYCIYIAPSLSEAVL